MDLTNKDIKAWIIGNGQEVSGYNTKKKLLGIVDTILNPPAPEPVVEEVAEVTIAEEALAESEGLVEETNEENITGDE